MKRFLFLCIFSSILSANSKNLFYFSPQNLKNPDYTWITQSPVRSWISLNGEWEYRASKTHPWQKTIIPSAYDYEGVLTFRKTFLIETPHFGNHFQLTAFGIHYSCKIKINQQYVGNHQGGSTSFTLEIPEGILRVGENNQIEIEIDNRLNPFDTIPLAPQAWSWQNFGGIFREIFIESVPPLYIDNYRLKLQLSPKYDHAELITLLKIRNLLPADEGSKSILCETEFIDPVSARSIFSTTILNPAESLQPVKLSLSLKSPNLWSPDHPILYPVAMRIYQGKKILDEIRLSIGVREFKIQGNEFILNGLPFVLKGVTYVENYKKTGNVTDFSLVRNDLKQIKTLGGNSVRFSQYPVHPFILTLCDQLGLVVFEELPIHNVPSHQISQISYQAQAKKCAEEMILRDIHHPCIVAWGIGNDFDTARPPVQKFVKEIVTMMKNLDSRPIYYTTRMISNDLCLDIPDFVGLNLYSHTTEDFNRKIKYWERKYTQKPFVVTRYGLDIFPGNRVGSGDPTSEDYQAKFFLETYQILRRKNPFGGSFIESFTDWKRAKPNLNVNPKDDPFMVRSGLTDWMRKERPAFEMVRTLYTQDKLPNILETNPISSSQAIFVLSGVTLFFLTAYWYRRNGRFRDNLFRALRHPFGFFSDIRDHRIIPLSHTVMIGFIIAGVISLFVTDFLYLNRRNIFFDFILNHLLINDFQKIVLYAMIWNPLFMSFFFLFFQLTGILTIMFLWTILTFPFNRSMNFLQAIHIGVWSGAHYLILVPVTIFLYPILQNGRWHLFLGFLLIGLILIHINRLFLGVRLASYLSFQRMFVVSFLFLAVIFTGILYYYHQNQASLYYFQFVLDLIRGNQIPT